MPITCPHCGREFPGNKLNARHLAKCNPESSIPVPPCLCGHESTSRTQMKRHRRTCTVWQNRDKRAVAAARRRETSLERYGVENAAWAPDVAARRQETVRERYGVDNLFQSDEIKARSRASMVERYGVEHNSHAEESQEKRRQTNLERRGVESPFASPGVQEKIRATMLERHGAENPQQVPEIQARTKATCEERYGGQLLASPEIRAKAAATNLERYGAAFAGGTPEVQAKVIKTNMERYGVPHTCMDPEVRRKQLEAMEEHYGSHFFASDEGKAAVRAVMLERYGVEFPGAIEGHWDRLVEIFKERLGVEHPLQLDEYLKKKEHTSLGRYGTKHAIQSQEVKSRMVATKIKRYGNPWGPCPQDGPNGLELRVSSLAPSLLFTGDFSFWRWLPLLGHHKNPDFIVPGPDPAKPKKGVTKVVEAFGDFWHSRMFTGKAPFDHEQELVDAFADIGIECLVLWESEVKDDPEGVKEQLRVFLEIGDDPGEAEGSTLDLFS